MSKILTLLLSNHNNRHHNHGSNHGSNHYNRHHNQTNNTRLFNFRKSER
jgi:hypothetical protein